MNSLISDIKDKFNYFYQEDVAYTQTTIVDLEKDFHQFAISTHHSEQQKILDDLFKKTVLLANKNVSVSSLMKEEVFHPEHLLALHSLGFSSIQADSLGIILEHSDLPGWLIKKNYGYEVQNSIKERIYKSVVGTDFPFWMLPSQKWDFPKNKAIGIKVPNDVINPLRVVMLKRGRQWIKSLHCHFLKACKEYLYQLPDADPGKPLYQRCVVISKKEKLMTKADTMKRFIQLANQNPERLKKIAFQICHWNKHTHLTDLQFNNFQFLDETSLPEKEKKDIIVFMDGEPVGGLSDVSEPVMGKFLSQYDPGFFPLLGLKKLQTSLSKNIWLEDVNYKDTIKMRTIFEDAIKQSSDEIIRERKWHYYNKTYGTILGPLISLVLNVIETFKIALMGFLTMFHKSDNYTPFPPLKIK